MDRSFLRDLLLGLRHLVLPGVCRHCHVLLPPDRDDFCTTCHAEYTTDPHLTCPRCAGTVGPFADLSAGCISCRGESFAFTRAVRLGPYEGALRDLILRMKLPQNEGLAEAVGLAWARVRSRQLEELGAEVVIPVPLHWWRRWRRGFNQSAVLAAAVANQLGRPLLSRCLRRVQPTPMQTTLTPTQRRENVKAAFLGRPCPELQGKTALLVDDVMTTGSTAHEAARALRAAGASDVVLAVLGHGHS